MEIDSDEDSTGSPPRHQQSTTTTATATADASTITPAQRIAELNSIDNSISTLLTSAATATAILANQGPNSHHSSHKSLGAAQADFTSAAQAYFSVLSSIEVQLRRQVYALEEAGLIRTGDERDARRGRTLNTEEGAVRRGGGGDGPLDPSWLNARISDGVERGKKRELLDQAKAVLERIQSARELQTTGGRHASREVVDDDDQKMSDD